MTALCRVLIAAALAVHMMVGCCWHHAHGCESESCHALADDSHDDPCPESHGDHSRDGNHSRHGENDCHGAKCSFVSAGRTIGHSLAESLQASLAAWVPDLPCPADFHAARFSPLSDGPPPSPVRLHLANQVLLI